LEHYEGNEQTPEVLLRFESSRRVKFSVFFSTHDGTFLVVVLGQRMQISE